MSTDPFRARSAFSLEFFARGVPRLLRQRVFGPRPQQSAFVPHVRIGQTLALFACLGLAVASAQSARNGSVVGILLLGIAVAAMLALVIHSAWEARTYPLIPEAFAIGPFIFCLILGIDVGLAAGRGAQVSMTTRIACGVMGMVAGYIVGSLAGLFTQRLGWIAAFISFIALLASAGLILLAVILFV
jgi:hypothetical protein